MAGDYSRKTFLPEKHYSGVLMQQGRVQLDADWNEQWEIVQHRTIIETIDVIGQSGVPKKGGGFKISMQSGDTDLPISAGRIYVDGLLFEQEKASSYFNQPYYPAPDASYFIDGAPAADSPLDSPAGSPPGSPINGTGLADGSYIVYLDGWQREINFLDDPHIHEVALGEADTATRMQNIWQVKLLEVTAQPEIDYPCKTAFPEWGSLVAPRTGRMNAQTAPTAPNANPCEIPAKSGYRGLENQLYRVEVQKGTDASNGYFKWSRDNATVTVPIVTIKQKDIIVSDLGKDAMLGFAINQWVEIVDDEANWQDGPNPLVQIKNITPGLRLITVDRPVDAYALKTNLKLRRWDQPDGTGTADGIPMSSGWTDLESGIQVNFSPGTYRAGDYWLIPARTATGTIEWPPFGGTSTLPQSPAGTRHHYCRLAFAEVSGGKVTLVDCRESFPSLTNICASDICYDNNYSHLQADTVQEGLDMLGWEERLTRSRLIGIGIVCGLEVQLQRNGNGQVQSITITKGCGVTSDGTLINIEASTYAAYTDYDTSAKKYYDPFVDSSVTPAVQKIGLEELRESAGPGVSSLDTLQPEDKVCLLFVEELETSGGRFDQSGCCDRTVTIRLRPLLIDKNYVASNMSPAGSGGALSGLFAGTPDIKTPRWNIPAGSLPSTADIMAAYTSILAGDGASTPFPKIFQEALVKAWGIYDSIFPGEYPVNPFADMTEILLQSPIDMATKLKVPRSIYSQYLYDFLSDIVQAYSEFRRAGLDCKGSCCPAVEAFPRHLLLGELVDTGSYLSAYRHYFVPSPSMDEREGLASLRFLFKKLVVQENSFSIPGTAVVRITPSVYGKASLPDRAIPYYYTPDPLYTLWDYEKTLQGEADRNLSYNAGRSYNQQDDAVINPLKYDLESYNFLRIEGHVGLPYTTVQKELQGLIREYGLPVKLVIVQSSTEGSGAEPALSDWMKTVNGLQHKGGVTMGGTFVLVYNSDPLAEGVPEPVLRQGVVVADFFLPYICCAGDQTPAAFDINPRTFLFDDAHNYAFAASPLVTSAGTVQKNFQSADIQNPANLRLMTDAANILYLHPALPALAQTLQTTVSYKGISLPITIIRPDASFTIQATVDTAGAPALKVAPLNTDATEYHWTVNQKAGIFQDVAAPPAVSIEKLRAAANANILNVVLTIVYTLNGQTSRDIKSQIWQF